MMEYLNTLSCSDSSEENDDTNGHESEEGSTDQQVPGGDDGEVEDSTSQNEPRNQAEETVSSFLTIGSVALHTFAYHWHRDLKQTPIVLTFPFSWFNITKNRSTNMTERMEIWRRGC